MPITPIHYNMRRRLIYPDKSKGDYLHEDDSCLLAGTSWRQQQQATAGTEGLTVAGNFDTPQIGTYVQNITRGVRAQIATTSGNELTLHYPLYSTGTNWGPADDTGAGKLINSSESFTSQDIEIGDIVALRNLSDHAIITAIDSDTQLSVSKDIFPSGTKYTIMKGFREGDTVQLGTAVLDGSAGQVMVEIPRFWFGHSFDIGKHQWTISPTPRSGLQPHYAFLNPDGSINQQVYISAFEGSCGNRAFGDGLTLTSYDLNTATLQSLPGLRPITNGQRSEFRKVAGNVGPGWQQIDWYINWAWQLLFMTEYEDMDSQAALSDAMTDWSVGTRDDWVDDHSNRAVVHTGNSLHIGNGTGALGGDGHAGGYLCYRGIENPWGNIWKWLDGVNYNDHRVYLANDPSGYEDDIAVAPYVDTGLDQPSSNGDISALHNSPRGLIPSESAGSGNSYIPDYYYENTGWRVAFAGGPVARGGYAGFAALYAHYSSSSRSSTFGSRVCLRN